MHRKYKNVIRNRLYVTLRGEQAQSDVDRIGGIAEYTGFRHHQYLFIFFFFQKDVTTRSPLGVNRKEPRARISFYYLLNIKCN